MAHELPAASPPPAPGSACLRVVVVDDNLDAGHMLGQWLQALGHEAVVLGSPQEALARARSAPVDVFLLDIGLPHMDGYELARQLRAQPCHALATFIAVTGYGQATDIAQSKQAGFDHHFVKPLDPSRLLAVLDLVGAREHAQVPQASH